MSAFFVSPSGNAHNVESIGGIKAAEGWFLMLANGGDELLDGIPAPTAVAVAWRDEAVRSLIAHQQGRHLKQVDWSGIAVGIDPQWAQTYFGIQPGPGPAPATAAAPAPAAKAASAARLIDRVPPLAAE